MNKYFKAISADVRRTKLLDSQDSVLLGFSAGPDSVVLLQWLLYFLDSPQTQLTLVYLNHQLRPQEVGGEIQLVQSYADMWQLTAVIQDIPVSQFSQDQKCSIETAGRILRRQHFLQLAKDGNIKHILTAHHGDDAVESFVMQLLRGAKSGLVGIRPKVHLTDEIDLIRPLLSLSKDMILELVHHNKWAYASDSSNLDLIYTRNQIRQNFLPLLKTMDPNYHQKMGKTMAYFQSLEQYLDSKADGIVASGTRREDGRVSFDRLALLALHEFEQRHCILRILNTYVLPNEADKQIVEIHVYKIVGFLERGHGAMSLPGNFSAKITRDSLEICPPIEQVRKA